MNGVHDLGGTDGLGPVEVPEDEPVFRAEWEKAAFAMFSMPFRAGFFGVDMFRSGIEQMHPGAYLLSPYYEHWLHSAEHWGLEKGVLDLDEIEERTRFYLDNPDAPLPEREDPELLAFVDGVVKAGAPAARPSDRAARFSVGDTVTVVDDSPYGHTRKARYVRGKTGVIERAHGTFIYPDSAGNGGPEAPEHVYTVKFTHEELWGAEAAEPNGVVYFDVWEPYIVPATTSERAA
jgi:nitrile hydratase beta subunit